MKIGFKTFDEDRTFIENKYHDTTKPFDGFRRYQYHGYEYDESTGLSDEELDTGLAKIADETKSEPRASIKSKLFEFVLDNTRIDANEHDYFACFYSWCRPIAKYTTALWGWNVWAGDTSNEDEATVTYFRKSGAAYTGLDYDHTVPDWDSLLTLGFDGILKRLAESYEKKQNDGTLTEKQEIFYRAAKREYEAIKRLLTRMAAYARGLGHEKAEITASSLECIRDGGAKTTFDALNMIYIYFMLSEHVDNYQVRSLGYGLDSTIEPYVKSDIASGRFSEEEISEFIAYFLMQFSAIGNYWGQPVYLGGTNLDGTSKVSDITRMILDVYDKIGIYNPKLQIKVNKNTPNDFLKKALEMIKGGNSSIVFINEEIIVRALMSGGTSYDAAVDSVISGCYEYKTKAGGVGISGSTFNALKFVELVFSQGYDERLGIQIGPRTKPIEEMTSFEEFYAAYREMHEAILDKTFELTRKKELTVHERNPAIMFSGTLPACARQLRDALDSAVNNGSGGSLNGLGSAVDALMGVYELVFEKKITTLTELRAALKANWVGYEKLRAMALSGKHKYGIGDPMADAYADAIHRFHAGLCKARKNSRGIPYGYELHSAREFINMGRDTGATPDGRLAGEETSKNASPTVGMDKKGVTALIKSATALDHALSNIGACLDVMLHPSAVMGDDGTDAFLAVLRTYMERGGASIHFNVFDAKILRDAQEHPEKYKNLQVRVCGWNVLWSNMEKSEQDAYIKRAESIV